MKTITTLAVLAALAFATPATATPAAPALDYPLVKAATGDTVVQIQAPGQAWGIRGVARHIDGLVDGLTIHTTGTCASRPGAVCVTVTVRDYPLEEEVAMAPLAGDRGWNGLTVFTSDRQRDLHFDTSVNPAALTRQSRRGLAAHELGHALGLGHHRSRGITSTTTPWEHRPSRSEVRVLQEWFTLEEL